MIYLNAHWYYVKPYSPGPKVFDGDWCQSSKVASAFSNISARLSASDSGLVHSNGQGKSMKYENSGEKLRATVLVIRSS